MDSPNIGPDYPYRDYAVGGSGTVWVGQPKRHLSKWAYQFLMKPVLKPNTYESVGSRTKQRIFIIVKIKRLRFSNEILLFCIIKINLDFTLHKVVQNIESIIKKKIFHVRYHIMSSWAAVWQIYTYFNAGWHWDEEKQFYNVRSLM